MSRTIVKLLLTLLVSVFLLALTVIFSTVPSSREKDDGPLSAQAPFIAIQQFDNKFHLINKLIGYEIIFSEAWNATAVIKEGGHKGIVYLSRFTEEQLEAIWNAGEFPELRPGTIAVAPMAGIIDVKTSLITARRKISSVTLNNGLVAQQYKAEPSGLEPFGLFALRVPYERNVGEFKMTGLEFVSAGTDEKIIGAVFEIASSVRLRPELIHSTKNTQ